MGNRRWSVRELNCGVGETEDKGRGRQVCRLLLLPTEEGGGGLRCCVKLAIGSACEWLHGHGTGTCSPSLPALGRQMIVTADWWGLCTVTHHGV